MAYRGLVRTRKLRVTKLMTKVELIKHMGKRLYVRYSIHHCIGTLVQINGDVAVFDSANQIWIPCITSVSEDIPDISHKPAGKASNLPANLLELFE